MEESRPGEGGTGRRAGSWLPWLLIGVAGALFAAILALWRPPDDPAFTVCALRRFLHLPCPGCGLTRGVAALLRGEVGTAVCHHPLSVILPPEAAAGWLLAATPSWPLLRRHLPAVALVHAGVLVALWLGRVATGTLPW